MKRLILLILIQVIHSLKDENDEENIHMNRHPLEEELDFRRHYGYSFNICPQYIKSFKCLTACKSIGFQVFRLNADCKCSCHEMRTTTILPFMKWKTNGTTRTVPMTKSPALYEVAGTFSPPTELVQNNTDDNSTYSEPDDAFSDADTTNDTSSSNATSDMNESLNITTVDSNDGNDSTTDDGPNSTDDDNSTTTEEPAPPE